jgi:hypothetical protein
MRNILPALFLLTATGCGGVDLTEALPEFLLEDVNPDSDRYGEGRLAAGLHRASQRLVLHSRHVKLLSTPVRILGPHAS